jgi:hypothetical protein
METLVSLSNNIFYKMRNYSQLVIDLVEEVEEAETYNEASNTLNSINYRVGNVLEVIDKNRIADVEALQLLSKIINQMVENQSNLEKK